MLTDKPTADYLMSSFTASNSRDKQWRNNWAFSSFNIITWRSTRDLFGLIQTTPGKEETWFTTAVFTDIWALQLHVHTYDCCNWLQIWICVTLTKAVWPPAVACTKKQDEQLSRHVHWFTHYQGTWLCWRLHPEPLPEEGMLEMKINVDKRTTSWASNSLKNNPIIQRWSLSSDWQGVTSTALDLKFFPVKSISFTYWRHQTDWRTKSWNIALIRND